MLDGVSFSTISDRPTVCNSFHFFALGTVHIFVLGTGYLSYSLHFPLRYVTVCIAQLFISFQFFALCTVLFTSLHLSTLSRSHHFPHDALAALHSLTPPPIFPLFPIFSKKNDKKNVIHGHIQRLKAAIFRGSAGNENPVQSSQKH